MSSPLAAGLFGTQNIYSPYFTNSPITRLSSLRQSNDLLHRASRHPSAKYICMHELNPLRNNGSLQFLDYNLVEPIIGEPYKDSEKVQTSTFDSTVSKPTLVFLGLDLETKAGTGHDLLEIDLDKHYKGIPYFALDVTHVDEQKRKALTSGSTAQFTPTRVDLTLSSADSAIYAQARSYLDWHSRNTHCSSCGSPTLIIQGGAKLVCPPVDRGVKRKSCPTRIGLHNSAFPRTDPTLIAAPVSADYKRVLLGRGKRWPDNYWSCLSGFIEPAESMESATRREVWEESGVKVGDVVIHSSQAWPYPSTLLVGTIGLCATKNDEAITYPEKELGEARWFEFGEVEAALDKGHAMWEEPPKGWTGIRVPPDKLMAHRTLRGVIKMFKR